MRRELEFLPDHGTGLRTNDSIDGEAIFLLELSDSLFGIRAEDAVRAEMRLQEFIQALLELNDLIPGVTLLEVRRRVRLLFFSGQGLVEACPGGCGNVSVRADLPVDIEVADHVARRLHQRRCGLYRGRGRDDLPILLIAAELDSDGVAVGTLSKIGRAAVPLVHAAARIEEPAAAVPCRFTLRYGLPDLAIHEVVCGRAAVPAGKVDAVVLGRAHRADVMDHDEFYLIPVPALLVVFADHLVDFHFVSPSFSALSWSCSKTALSFPGIGRPRCPAFSRREIPSLLK